MSTLSDCWADLKACEKKHKEYCDELEANPPKPHQAAAANKKLQALGEEIFKAYAAYHNALLNQEPTELTQTSEVDFSTQPGKF